MDPIRVLATLPIRARPGGWAVGAVRSTQHRDRNHYLVLMGALLPVGSQEGYRGALADALVRPRAVEVGHVLRRDAARVPLPEQADEGQPLA